MLSAGVARSRAGPLEWIGSHSADTAPVLAAGPAPAQTTVDGGTTAGVASLYGAVTLVVLIGTALGVLSLWWRRRRST